MASRSRVHTSLVGRFISDKSFGPVKIIGTEQNKYKIEYFLSPWNRKVVLANPANLEHLRLYEQTRVYIENDGRWKIGRVVSAQKRDDGAYDYKIQFPNKVTDTFPEEQVYCRCWLAHDDPTSTLASGGTETQYWHEHRLRFAETLLEQRFACRGLSALLSSRIELVPHQLEVARRVLEDPLQRYLLADEVGMGKTIEAGLIIRQFLLSNPKGGSVWVIAPGALVVQWREELTNKFGTAEFGDRVHIFRADEVDTLPASTPELLVVDEAHHFVSTAIPLALKKLVLDTPRLLLLSATPALGRSDTLLRLLSLLDSDCYGAIELGAFEAQVEKREEIGIFLRGLRADANPVVLKQRLRRLPELFPSDAEATRLGEAITKALSEGDTGGVRRNVITLRGHIADVHRIHQRLIRTRRRDAVDWAFRPRGPESTEECAANLEHVRMTWIDDSRFRSIFDLFEQWRMEVSALYPAGSPDRKDLAKYALTIFEGLGTNISRFDEALGKIPERFLGQEWRCLFASAIENPNEEPSRASQIAGDIRRHLEILRQSKHNQIARIAVFGTDPADLIECAETLAQLIGESKVFVAWEIDDDLSNLAAAFESDPYARVIFCSPSEEEGLNLHFVDAIVHLDLPFSPSRIEQRIGRLDRFGRKLDRLEHRIVFPAVDEQSSLWEAWFDVLAHGFRIFNVSVTDVQFILDEIAGNLSEQLLEGGASGLRAQIDSVSKRLKEERNRLDNQYALDVVLQEEDSAIGLFQTLDDLEADEEQIAHATTGWMLNSLLFSSKGDYSKVFRFQWDPDRTLLPVWPWAQLFKPALDGFHTFKRSYALRDEGLPQLVRIGSPLMRRIEREYRWDDRGTAYATWRHIPDFENGEWLGFKLCYIVEARLPRELDEKDKASVAARLDTYLPPWIDVFYIDAELNVVEDVGYLRLLNLPYDKGRDTNIGSRPELLDGLINRSQFEQICRDVREASESWLRNSGKYIEVVSRAVETGTMDINRRILRLEQRRLNREAAGETEDSGLAEEVRLNKMLLEVLANPIVRLDSIGLTVLSSRSPSDFLSGEVWQS